MSCTTVTRSLEPDSITLAPGYDAIKEDPDIYKTTDFCGYSAPRHFPEMALPIQGVPVQQQQQPSSGGRSPASAPGPVVPHQPIEVMQTMHDEQVRFLKSLGRNPCEHFRERNDERILNNLGTDVVVCPFCGRKCRNNQKLKSHCKRHHCRSAALKCKSCGKAFGDAYALKVHMRLHSNTGLIYKCHLCNMAYITRSKLNEHNNQHIKGRPQCNFCNKQLADSKTLADHVKVCPQQPGIADLSEEQRKPH